MTLIELIVFVVMISIGVTFSKCAYKVGGFWLAVPGFFLGCLLIPGSILGYERYRKWAYLGDKWMPPCSCGSEEYKPERRNDHFYTICRQCGAVYDKRKNQVFLVVDDQIKLYRTQVKHKGWV
jgi:hypothetical protein